MGHHIDGDGRFQSDRHPELPPDHITLDFSDPRAQLALSVLALDYRGYDRELSEDIEERLSTVDVRLLTGEFYGEPVGGEDPPQSKTDVSPTSQLYDEETLGE